jgi:hypothetical protein
MQDQVDGSHQQLPYLYATDVMFVNGDGGLDHVR